MESNISELTSLLGENSSSKLHSTEEVTARASWGPFWIICTLWETNYARNYVIVGFTQNSMISPNCSEVGELSDAV